MASGRPRSPAQSDTYDLATAADYSQLRATNAPTANTNRLIPDPDMAYAPTAGNPAEVSPLSQSLNHHAHVGKFSEDFDASQRGSSIMEDHGLRRSNSTASTHTQGGVSRSGTLKKKNSLSRRSSLKKSASRRSLHAGSIKGVSAQDDAGSLENPNSVFVTPIPTTGNPTEILANRFQAWRKLLKDIVAYFREVQTSYESRAKALLRVSNVINNTNAPPLFLTEGGINEANRILRDYHKQAVVEANKARDIEIGVIQQLSGLRADLGSKIKEIKSLSGDFKNSVEKEKEGTRKAVAALEDALAAVDVDPSAVSGKGDPYVVRLGVDRQVERQIDEENYLHRAYLNLEGSGRELESIVIGEIQKAYTALANILKRDADESYSTVEKLKSGPIAMPKDFEWTQFVEQDPHFVSPSLSLRRLEEIEYPGKHHPAAAEVRAGMLERKTKYLKSYTPGWYVLSPTHLHEFKSADRIYTQPPVMSLYLPEQKLGTHSQPGSSSHKFVLKGRQTGAMHRGHSWVFRAESFDTMMAWYEDIKSLTEKSGEERNSFVRRHVRSTSAGSARSVRSVSDSGLEEDEADQVPYSANHSVISQSEKEPAPTRPSPGGRFPSDIQLNGHLQAPLSPSSGSSEIGEHDLTTATGGLGAYGQDGDPYRNSFNITNAYQDPQPRQHADYLRPAYGQPEHVHEPPGETQVIQLHSTSRTNPTLSNRSEMDSNDPQVHSVLTSQHNTAVTSDTVQSPDSTHRDPMAPESVRIATIGVIRTETLRRQQQEAYAPSAQRSVEESSYPETQVSQSQPTPDPEMTATLSSPFSVDGALLSPSSAITDESNFTTVSSEVDDPGFQTHTTIGSTLDKSAKLASGTSFPVVRRNNTDMSVSDLHVPGEYPQTMKRY